MPGLVARTQVEFQPPPAPVPGSLCWSPAAYPWWGPCPPVKSPPVRCGVIGHACCRGPSAAPPSPSLFSSVQALSRVRLFATPWPAARQASLSITNSQHLLKLVSIESVMPSSHLHPLSSPSAPAFSLSQHRGLFQRVSSLYQVAKVLEFQVQLKLMN